jgi:hypothetical protein
MWINAPLSMLENLIPKVHEASQPLPQFPPMWKCCGKTPPFPAGVFWSGGSDTMKRQRALRRQL